MTIVKGPKKYAQTVGEIVQDRPVLTFNPNDTVQDMLQRMHAQKTGAGGVVDKSGKFIGLITEREIVRKIFGNVKNFEERMGQLFSLKDRQCPTAWYLMIACPQLLHPDDNVESAQEVITYFGYRYMPVIDHKDLLLGIIDAREIHQHVYAKSKDIIEVKDTLLSYFMGTEPYGIGANI